MTDSWDDPDARRRLLQAIRDEPACDNPDCCPKETTMTKPETAYKIAKYTIISWAIFVVMFLAAAMVFGPELS
jgi:hypothetical protein